MSLAAQLTDYIHACFTGLWICTQEPDEAQREILRHAAQAGWTVACWDVASGLQVPSINNSTIPENGAGDPLAVLRALPALAKPEGTALLLLHNFHRYLGSPEVIQLTFQQLLAGKQQRTFLVVLAPVVQIPVELEKLFVVLEHALPDRQQLLQIARELTVEEPSVLPQGDHLERVLDAAAGLTRYEAEGAFALSLSRHGSFRPESIWELKAQTLKKNNLLTLHKGEERFASLGGLDNLKQFCLRTLRSSSTVKPRGIILLGVAGVGKSQFAKSLGNEVGRPTLLLDIGALYGSLVGQTEAQVRQALRIVDAMSPCVAFIDEIEKALSGFGGQGDSGVSTRLFGTLLTWLSDRTSDTYVVATCNDISKLPPEFGRSERWDAIFFLDLPSAVEKAAIWKLYRQHYGIADSDARPSDDCWTGAEIKSCCRLAVLLGVSLKEAAQHVVPVAVTAAEQVEKLRSWASGRCLDASVPGLYQRSGSTPSLRRRVRQDPHSN